MTGDRGTTTNRIKKMTKKAIIAALRAFIAQRPGLDYANYGDPKTYNAEARSIRRDGATARQLLAVVEAREEITSEFLQAACKSAFTGRLSLVEKGDKVGVDYCTGQYWPTEYRAAACAVLAQALWDDERRHRPAGEEKPGDAMRRNFRLMFGRAIQKRWFD